MNYLWLIISLFITTFKFQFGYYAVTNKRVGHYLIIYPLNLIIFLICLFSGRIFFNEIYLLEYGILFITYLFIVNDSVKNNFVSLLISGFFLSGISICLQDIFGLSDITKMQGYEFNPVKFLIRSAVVIVLLTIIILLRRFTFKDNTAYAVRNMQFPAIILALTIIAAVGSLHFLFQTTQILNAKHILYISSFLMLVSIMCIFLLFLHIRKVNDILKKNNDELTSLKDSQKKYYELLLKREEDTRIFRHDIKNHFVVLEDLANDPENKKLKNYISKINEKISYSSDNLFPIGNKVLESLTNHYLSSVAPDTDINVYGIVPDEIKIEDISLCIIYGNLLKNSVEAVKNINSSDIRPFININFYIDKNYLRIMIDNSFSNTDNSSVFQHNMLKQRFTTKSEPLNHGYGLISVKEEINRLNGIINFNIRENVFHTAVGIPLD